MLPRSEETDPQPPDAPGSSSPFGAGGLFSHYALLFGADVATRGLRFLADLLLVRHFGQSVYGQLNLAQSLAVQGVGVATCGLDTFGMRAVAIGPGATPTIAATVVLLRCLIGMATWAVLAGVSWLVPQFRDSLLLAGVYGLSILTGALNLGWVAQGRGQAHLAGLSILATHVAWFGGVQLVIHFDWPPVSVPAVLIAAELLTAAILWLWIVRTAGPIRNSLPTAATLRFLGDALPIGGANLLRGLTAGSDVLLLGLFVSTAEVGLYSGAFKLYSLGLSAVTLYFTVLLPYLARRAAESLPAVMSELHSALRRSLAAALPLTVAGFFLAGFVLRLLFPPGFEAATGALQILVVVVPLQLMSGQFRTALVAVGRQRYNLGLVAIGAAAHISAKLALIPLLGITGAAWGTLIGEAALLVASWYVAQTILREPAVRS